MRIAVFYAMVTSLWRDKAAFALTFLLPPAIYLVFASIFSATAGGDLSIRLAISAPNDDISSQIVQGIEHSELISSLVKEQDPKNFKHLITKGDVDAAIEITRIDDQSPPQFKIYYDQAKASAADIAEIALANQATLFEEGDDEEEDDLVESVEPAQKIAITGSQSSAPMAAYYAAGVGMLFLFLSGFQSALSVIEERDAGVMERIAAGPFGLRPMIDGKFLFLLVQGGAQLTIILLIARIIFSVPLTQSPLQLIITIIATSICASGLSLLVVGSCRTRSQAHAIGAVLALLMGALGGSMAPRFLMAPEIRAIGAWTPNSWGIEAFAISLWRGGNLDYLWGPWFLLIGSGCMGLIVSYFMMRRTLRAD